MAVLRKCPLPAASYIFNLSRGKNPTPFSHALTLNSMPLATQRALHPPRLPKPPMGNGQGGWPAGVACSFCSGPSSCGARAGSGLGQPLAARAQLAVSAWHVLTMSFGKKTKGLKVGREQLPIPRRQGRGFWSQSRKYISVDAGVFAFNLLLLMYLQ